MGNVYWCDSYRIKITWSSCCCESVDNVDWLWYCILYYSLCGIATGSEQVQKAPNICHGGRGAEMRNRVFMLALSKHWTETENYRKKKPMRSRTNTFEPDRTADLATERSVRLQEKFRKKIWYIISYLLSYTSIVFLLFKCMFELLFFFLLLSTNVRYAAESLQLTPKACNCTSQHKCLRSINLLFLLLKLSLS